MYGTEAEVPIRLYENGKSEDYIYPGTALALFDEDGDTLYFIRKTEKETEGISHSALYSYDFTTEEVSELCEFPFYAKNMVMMKKEEKSDNGFIYTIEAGVTSVDSLAFENVDTNAITELVIGKDVENIDFAYINTFPALTKVTVDAENAHYRGYEDQYGAYFLMSLRSNEIFYIPSTEDNAVYLWNEDALAEEYNANENISLYTCGGLLNVYFTQDEYETYWHLTNLSYDGITKEIGYNKQISGNCSFCAFRINGGFVATHAYYTWSNAFIFKDGAFIEHNPDREVINGIYDIVCEGDGIRFYPGENGELLYSRITERMVAMQTPDWFLHLTSAEDFWKEDGIITISDGALVFTPTKTYTVTDYLAGRGTTVEEEFEKMKANGWFDDADKWPYLGCETLEELFAANSVSQELTPFLNKTFSMIETEGYTLEYSHMIGGGWPVYSVAEYEGASLVFDEQSNDAIPIQIEITSANIKVNPGLRVSMTGEEAKEIVTSWDDVFFSLENGGRIYSTAYTNHGYKLTAYWSMPDDVYNELLASLPEDGGDEAYVEAKKKLVEPFKDNPVGEIVQLTIEKTPANEQSPESENQNTGFTLQTYMRELVAYMHEPFSVGKAQYPDTILGLVYEYCFYNRDIIEGVTVNEETFGVAIEGDMFRTVAKSLLGDNFSVSGRDLVGGGYDEANDRYTTSYAKDYWGGDRYTIEWGSAIDVYEEDGKVTVTAMVGANDEVYGTYVPFRKLEYTFTKVKAVGCYHYRLDAISEVEESTTWYTFELTDHSRPNDTPSTFSIVTPSSWERSSDLDILAETLTFASGVSESKKRMEVGKQNGMTFETWKSEWLAIEESEYEYVGPYSGVTDEGYAYYYYYRDPQIEKDVNWRIYSFLVLPKSGSAFTISIHHNRDYDPADYLETVILPAVNSVVITQTIDIPKSTSEIKAEINKLISMVDEYSSSRHYADYTYNLAYLRKLYSDEPEPEWVDELDAWVEDVLLKQTAEEQEALPTLVQAIRALNIEKEELVALNDARRLLGDAMLLTDTEIDALYIDDEKKMKKVLVHPLALYWDGEIYTWFELKDLDNKLDIPEDTWKAYYNKIIEYQTPGIVEIIDIAKRDNIPLDDSLQNFYSDSEYEYFYFGNKSEYVVVKYSNGSEKTAEEALQDGDITIGDLDKYEIAYRKVEK